MMNDADYCNQRIKPAKLKMRKKLARLPFEEKIVYMVKLQHIAANISANEQDKRTIVVWVL